MRRCATPERRRRRRCCTGGRSGRLRICAATPGAGSSAGENEYQSENTGYAGRVPYFLAVLPLGEEVRSGGGHRGGHGLSGRRWAKARRTNRNVKERWNLDISDWQTSDLPPLHKFHIKTLACIRRTLRVLVRCAEKSFDVPSVYMIRRNIL